MLTCLNCGQVELRAPFARNPLALEAVHQLVAALPNLPNQTYQTKPNKLGQPSLPNYNFKTKPNRPNQDYPLKQSTPGTAVPLAMF